MFKPLANPESLIIIGGFSYLPTKSDQFGHTMMLALAGVASCFCQLMLERRCQSQG
jgi:hypothetical protein